MPGRENEKENEIVLSRTFDAPRELVWDAWTNPLHLMNWWGPTGFTTTIEVMDLRPGGKWNLTMWGPDGAEYPNFSTFTEVVKPERIRYTLGGGRKGAPATTFDATWTFDEKDSKTTLTLRFVFATKAARDLVADEYGAIEGGKQTLGRLDEHLRVLKEKRREITLTRILDAPRELVFKAWTDPKMMAQWWGPAGSTNPICEADARTGGAIRILMKGESSEHCFEHLMTGTFKEVTPPSKLVFTATPLDANGKALLDCLTTVIFEEEGPGKTRLIVHQSAKALVPEAVLMLAGMNMGWNSSLDRLQEFVAKSG